MPRVVTPDLYDANEGRVAVIEAQFRGFGQRAEFFGPCETVKCFEDHRLVKALSETAGQGRVLVVDGGGAMRVALMGDRLAARLAENGWAGAVVYGVIRDTPQIDPLDFGVKALGTTARRSGPEPLGGATGIPVSFGGATISPGDWVYADRDAVLVSATELKL